MTRLQPGDPAPSFSLAAHDGSTVTLSDFTGHRLVMFVYPAAMTPGCTTQACDFRDSLTPLREAGYAVVGLSPDPVQKLVQFAEQESLTYPLLSDPDKNVITAYGAYGPKRLYGKEVLGVIRSTFVVDGEGRIEVAKYNVKATGHVASLAKALRVTL